MAQQVINSSTPEALDFFNRAANLMATLAGRWKDESANENIQDYLKPFQTMAHETGVALMAMKKSPFGITFRVGEREFHAFIKGRNAQYKRTK